MGEENCPRQSGVQLWQQNAKNLAISAQNGNKKVTQNCNTRAGKFVGRKFLAQGMLTWALPLNEP
jgi:hypothetical protein